MKYASKLLAILAVVAMLLSVVPFAALAAPTPTGDNVVVNGDFETGDMTGWTTYQGTAAEAAAAKEGSYGAHLKGSGGWGSMMHQTVSVEAGKEYYFAFWIKVNDQGVNMSLTNMSNQQKVLSDWLDNKYASWTLKEYTFTAPVGCEEIYINFNGGNTGTAEDIFVDSMQFYCITEEKPSFDGYVTNGDFEFGDLDGWIATDVIAKKVAGHDSATGVEVTSTKWNSLYQYITVTTHTDYVITAWAKKAENHSGSYNLLLKNGSTNLKEIEMDVTDEWQKFSFDFNSGSATSLRLMVMANVDNSTIVVDDISVAPATGGDEASALANGGFESGAEGWTLGDNAVIETKAGGAQVYEGNAALKTDEASSGGLLAEQKVAVNPGTDYVVSLWYYCYTTVSNNPAFYFDVDGADPDYEWEKGTFKDRKDNRQYAGSLNTWVLLRLKFKSGSSNVTIRIRNYRKDAGQYYFDEVTLVEYDENDYSDYIANSNKKKASGTDVRVMSYNVLMDDDASTGGVTWGKTLDKLLNGGEGTRDGNAAQCIAYYAPDIIGFQEFSYNWYQGIREALPNYAFVNNVDPESNKEDYMCTALAYNTDTIELVHNELYKLTKSRWGNQRMRYINMAIFKVKATGKTFMVTNTHPDAGKVDGDGMHRPAQLLEFAEQVVLWQEEYGLPIISTGDFNSGAASDEFKAYVELTGMRDSNANNGGSTIDHVMINDMVQSLYATVITDPIAAKNVASDHAAIFSDLKLLDGATYEIETLISKIKTQGRTTLVDGTLMLDWSVSGIEFEAKCSGTVSATFNAKSISDASNLGGVYFTIVVDGVEKARDYFRISQRGEITVNLAENLPEGKHTFAIYRQTEHDAGEVGISTISMKGSLLAKPADKEMYIEFIGDSISAGFGNLSNNPNQDNAGKPLYQDGTKAYTFLTAKALDADFSNVCWSGIGCKYGYGSITMQDVYPLQRYKYDKNTAHDFEAREPDVVVLALGTNDNSNQKDAAKRKAGMEEMLTLVREKNPNAKIVWIYNMMTSGVNDQVQEIVREFGGAEKGYYCVKLTMNTSGGGWHPNLEGQQKFADELADFITKNLGRPGKVLTEVSVSSTPEKTVYLKGEDLDLTGLVLQLTYDDGSVEYVSEGYKTRGFQSITTGKRKVTITYEGFSVQFEYEVVEEIPVEPPVEPAKNGWVKEDGKWAYYVDDVKTTEKWVKDSQGWCYLDENGRMVYNKWIKVDGKWYFMNANGYMEANKWMKDSKGWVYVGSDGAMKTNAWVKDSVGWCYVGADGYCVTNIWKKDSIGWCYLDASGRMATNKWVKDSVGWCYVGADGYCVLNTWKKDSKGWCYLDADGRMTVSDWVQDGGAWYYLDENGYMVANVTLTIDGKTYTFASNGKLV